MVVLDGGHHDRFLAAVAEGLMRLSSPAGARPDGGAREVVEHCGRMPWYTV
jgi:hypothetical protein